MVNTPKIPESVVGEFGRNGGDRQVFEWGQGTRAVGCDWRWKTIRLRHALRKRVGTTHVLNLVLKIRIKIRIRIGIRHELILALKLKVRLGIRLGIRLGLILGLTLRFRRRVGSSIQPLQKHPDRVLLPFTPVNFVALLLRPFPGDQRSQTLRFCGKKARVHGVVLFGDSDEQCVGGRGEDAA
jgi:hypothetical protein